MLRCEREAQDSLIIIRNSAGVVRFGLQRGKLTQYSRCAAAFLALLVTACTELSWYHSRAPDPKIVKAQAVASCVGGDSGAVHSTLRILEVPGFKPALLFVPAGEALRPLLVAAHGAGGNPEWDCEYWRRLTAERAFLLCLRGTPLGSDGGYYYKDHHALDREFVAAENSARTAEPRIAAESGLYAGFSQGSSMGSAMIAGHGKAFPFLVLIEGFELWNIARAREFLRAGGRRVIIACGSKECAKVGRASVHWLQVAGVQSRLEWAPGAGHTPMGGVMTRVEADLPWLFAADPLWP